MATVSVGGDTPPSYEVEDDHSLPLYTCSVPSSECLLQTEPPRITNCPTCDWIFETKHMRINLGPRLWKLHTPSYGLNGRIEGTIRLSKDVETVTMTLEGRIRVTTISQRSTLSADTVLTLVSQTATIYDAQKAESSAEEDRPFSLTIPHETQFKEQFITLPPSHLSYHPLVSTEVNYTVKFHAKRKGKGLKKTESKTVRILYLPKSTPSEPPLYAIPRPSQGRDDTDLYHLYNRVKTIPLTPFHPDFGKSKSNESSLDNFTSRVFLSLPYPLCFSSGQIIPFTMSLAFPDDPFLALALRGNRIELFRRLNVWKKGSSEVLQRDDIVSSSALKFGREYSEGVWLLRGDIKAGDQGKEVSWILDGVAEVQYVLRVILRPSINLLGSVPCFKHEEVVKITTDSWGILDRELSSMGGTPTPAIGLAANVRQTK
ncbi:hypothetical protein AGABI1DRAFT_68854 [Agaricus bisporus var. burnettii JB137-S8]|uniref:Arrestin-like N-terminal domain-containing protein n=2 Tax=Agaricus bisporus var. burnettii TaxID=192524 RepID=K5W7M4_AGABU|nr:uncharacterized protein AGABI1DRAFT_68854 [Agaricus bisporus var. burnettii JB137-S8]EKM82854.1 hypothetical protein AGABI1DRAFT_68854 [Agaricus bisporus var. burnettii JB137-S8]